MAEKIRMNDQQFDALIRGGDTPQTRQIIGKMNEAERTYMRDRGTAVLKYGLGSQAEESAQRKAAITQPREAQKGMTTQSGGMLHEAQQGQWEATKGNVKFALGMEGGVPSPQLKDWASRQRQMDGGIAPIIDPAEAREFAPQAGSAAIAATTAPTSLANLPVGLGEMVMKPANAIGDLMQAFDPTGVTGGGSFKEEVISSKENVEELGGMVGELLVHGLWNLPKAYIKAGLGYGSKMAQNAVEVIGLEDYIGVEEYAKNHGLNGKELVGYLEEDPVGTALFTLSYLKGAVQYKRYKAKQRFKQGKSRPGEAADFMPETTLDRAKAVKPVRGGTSGLTAEDAGFQERALKKFREMASEKQLELDTNKAGKLRADEHAALWDAAQEMTRQELLLERKRMGKGERMPNEMDEGLRKTDAEMYKKTGEVTANEAKLKHQKALDKVAKLLDEEETRLRALRDSRVEAVRPSEIAAVAKKYPVAWNTARVKLVKTMEMFRDNIKGKWADYKSALVDELALIHPGMSRTNLRALMKKQAQNYADAGSLVDAEVAWAIEKIASARAARGQSNTPITTPVGRWNKSKLSILNRTSNRLQKFWESEIKGGDDLAKPTAWKPTVEGEAPPVATRRFGNKMPGEAAAFSYDGKGPGGIELWTSLENKHGFSEGQRVSTRTLEAMGFEIERPQMPKAKGTELPHNDTGLTENQLLMDDAIAAALPDVVQGNIEVISTLTRSGEVVVNAMKDATRPATMPLERLGKQAEPLATALHDVASAQGYSGIVSGLKIDTIFRRLSENGAKSKSWVQKQLRDFAELLHDEKRQAAVARRAEAVAIKEEIAARLEADPKYKMTANDKQQLKWAEEVDVETNLPVMPEAKRAEFENSSQFQVIDSWWREEVQPLIEEHAVDAGIQSSMHTPKGYYVKSTYVTDPKAMDGPNVKLLASEFGRSEGTNLGPKTKTKASASRVFKGRMGKNMGIDLILERVIHSTLVDRFQHGAKARMIAELKRWDHTERGGGHLKAGMTLKRNGKSYKLAEINDVFEYVEGTGYLKRNKLLVPQEVADAYHRVTKLEPSTQIQKLVDGYKRTLTGAALLTPAEGMMHTVNLFHTAAWLGDFGLSKNVGGKITQMTGSKILGGAAEGVTAFGTSVGRVGGLMFDIMTQDAADVNASMTRLARAGALRMSDMVAGDLKPTPNHATKVGAKIGGLVQKGHKLPVFKDIKKSIFGRPNLNVKFTVKSVEGFREWAQSRGIETRIRISMLKALEKMEPGKADTYYANKINNYLGTYVKKLVPLLTEKLLAIDPFARAGTSHLKAAGKNLYNMAADPVRIVKGLAEGNLEMRQYTNSINAYMTIMGLYLLQREVSGYWPNDTSPEAVEYYNSVKPGDVTIPLGDGRRLDIPFRHFAGVMYKGLNYSGVYNTVQAMMQGEHDPITLKDEMTKAWMNLGMSRIGPQIKAPAQALSLKAFYLTAGSGEMKLMDLVEPTASTSGRGKQMLQAGAQQILPVPSRLAKEQFGVREFGEKPHTTFWKTIKGMADMTGLHTNIRSKDYSAQMMGYRAGKREKLVNKVAMSIYSGAMRQPEDERDGYIRDAIGEKFNDSEWGDAERYSAIQLIIQMIEGEAERTQSDYKKGMAYSQGAPGHVIPGM